MLCRLCVYESSNGNSTLLESNLKMLIVKYLHIEIAPSDEIPATIICASCLHRLQDFDDFSRTIVERQKVFKDIAENTIKLEIIEQESNPENESFTQETTKQFEFTYATCNNDIEESNDEKDLSDEEDVLLPTKKEEKQKDELIAQFIALDCELCQEKTESYRQLQQHFQKKHKQKAFITCCGKRFNKRSFILDHVQLHVNPDYLKFEHCDKQLKTRISLKHHIKLYHNRSNLQQICKICGKTFAYPSMLEVHMSVHTASRNHNCEVCQKGFKSKNALDVHTKNIHGEPFVHICDICGKEYRNKICFDQHVAEHQGLSIGRKKQCPICKGWVANSNFKSHTQRHEKIDVNCDACGKMFTSRPALMSHKGRHHNEKKLQSYNCPYCAKTFTRSRFLKEHIDLHTGHKEYSCKYCSREFRSKANMYAHQKKVHNELWAQEQLNPTTKGSNNMVLITKKETKQKVTNNL